jgi:hypothetical protein
MAETNLIDLSEPALPIDDSDMFIKLEEYHLDENTPESKPVSEPVRTVTKVTRKSRSWHLVRIYDDGPQAKEWLTQNPDWSLQKMYDTEAGMKKVFRCNLVRRRGPQCEKVIQFQYNSHNMKVLHFETTCDHTHDEILKHYKKPGINQVTKDAIKKQLDVGITKPKTILNNLAEEQLSNPGIEVPTDSQLFNFLQVLKRLNRNIDFNLNQSFNDDYLSFLPEIILFEEDEVSVPEVLGEGPRGLSAGVNKALDPVQVQATETDSVKRSAPVATTAPVDASVNRPATATAKCNRPAPDDQCQHDQVLVQLSATATETVTTAASVNRPATSTENATVKTTGSVKRPASAKTATVTTSMKRSAPIDNVLPAKRRRGRPPKNQ